MSEVEIVSKDEKNHKAMLLLGWQRQKEKALCGGKESPVASLV